MKKILFCLFIFFVNLTSAFAFDLQKNTYDGIYYVQNGLPEHYGSDSQFMFLMNGVTSYCVNVRQPIKSYNYNGVYLDNSIYSDEVLDYLNKVMYYGYDYPGHQNLYYYMATQALIWNKLTGYDISFYTERYGYGDFISVYNEIGVINSMVENHGKLPSFSNKILYYDDVESIELSDEFLSNYEIVSSNYDFVYIEGNSLKINNLSDYYGLITINFKNKNYRDDLSMYYFSGDSQEMISGGKLSDIYFSLSIQVNGSDLIINKKDLESGLFLKDSNTKFNVLNLDTNNYVYIDGVRDLSVDSEGILNIKNLDHGNYKIIEVSTDSFYSLAEPIVVNFNLYNIVDNSLSVDVYNSLIKSDLEIVKYGEVYDYEFGEADFINLSGVEFSLYSSSDLVLPDGRVIYSKDDLIGSSITDEFGKAYFNDLLVGDYYIVEDSNLDYEKIDNIDIFMDGDKSIDVYNYLKKGSINILKVDSSTMEGLSNVLFEVIHDGISIGVFETDVDGKINISDIPISTYLIKEVSSKDGYILDCSEYELDLNYEDEIVIKNDKIIELPNTYKNDFNLFYLFLGVLLLKRYL